ncbi:MAG: histidine phosphatase family protein [Bacteroidota bacterium]|nr:histidine phosphatase family protein [Bacteroidota bacterium]
MKRLYIVRHAKALLGSANLPDLQRPILEKGKQRTKLLLDYLLLNNTSVDMIISSPAVRALETALIVGNALRFTEEEIKKDSILYYADEEQLMNLFFDLPHKLDSLMIVGHNPTLTYFANEFIENKIEMLPTSACVCLDFDTDKWEDISSLNSKLRFVITPKTIKEKKVNRI